MRSAIGCIFVAIAVISANVAPAPAAPTVEIRAHTVLSIDSVRRSPDGSVVVSGQLRDRVTGAGVGQRSVEIRAGDQQLRTMTHPDGTFAAVFPRLEERVDVVARFGGGGALDATETTSSQVEVDKQQVALTLTVTPSQPGQPRSTRVTATATHDGKPMDVPLRLEVGTADGDLVDVGDLTPAGRELSMVELGGAGRKRARVSFAGDSVFATANTESVFEVTIGSRTELEIRKRRIAIGGIFTVEGRVTTDDGNPLPRASVAIVAGDRRLAHAVSDANGRYSAKVEAKVLGLGQHGLQSLLEPPSTFVLGSRSSPIVIAVAAPKAAPNTLTLVALAVTGMVVGAFLLARGSSWRRTLASRTSVEAKAAAPAAIVGGLSPRRSGILSTLRRASDFDFTGRVVDAVRSRPLANAHVNVTPATTEGARSDLHAVTPADGVFAFAGLAAGTWQVEVILDGFITERFTIAMPHRGELRDTRVDLIPVRERIFSMYRSAAEPALPAPNLWGVWSPRQIVDHVRAQRPSPALAALTDLVEEAYFSARHPAESSLSTASAAVELAIRERGQGEHGGADMRT